MPSASARAFCSHLLRAAARRRRGCAPMIESASTRALRMICADSWCRRSSSTLGLLGIVERLPDRLLTALERLQQRPPRKLRQQRQQHQEGQDRPDEQARVRLDERVIHDACPFTGASTSGWPSIQHDQQHEHFGEDRHAFEQEERKVDGAGDLVGGAGCRAMPSAAAAASLPMPRPAPITTMPRPIAAPSRCSTMLEPPPLRLLREDSTE